MVKNILKLLLIACCVLCSIEVFAKDYSLHIKGKSDVFVYINGFPFYTKSNDVIACTQALKAGTNQVIIKSSSKAIVEIVMFDKPKVFKIIFKSITESAEDDKMPIVKDFVINDIDYKLEWQKADDIENLKAQDKTKIEQIVLKYIDSFKNGNFKTAFESYMKYDLENFAKYNKGYNFEKAKASFNFLYNEFLTKQKRLQWEEPRENILIQKSKYNSKLIIVRRKNNQALFNIKTSLQKDYVKYFLCFIKVGDEWFLQ